MRCGYFSSKVAVWLHESCTVPVRGISQVLGFAYQKSELLRRGCASDVVAKFVAEHYIILRVNEHQVVQVRSPPGPRFADIGGAIHFHAQFPQGIGAHVALGLRVVHKKNALFLERTRNRDGKRQRNNRRVHAAVTFGFAADEVAAALTCGTRPAMSSRLRFRCAIFCLRFRLNLDLSPLIPDIFTSCFSCGESAESRYGHVPGPASARETGRSYVCRSTTAMAGSAFRDCTPCAPVIFSIAKAQSAGSVFEVKHFQYTLCASGRNADSDVANWAPSRPPLSAGDVTCGMLATARLHKYYRPDLDVPAIVC